MDTEIFTNSISMSTEHCGHNIWHVFMKERNGIYRCDGCRKILPKGGIFLKLNDHDDLGKVLAFPRNGSWWMFTAHKGLREIRKNDKFLELDERYFTSLTKLEEISKFKEEILENMRYKKPVSNNFRRIMGNLVG